MNKNNQNNKLYVTTPIYYVNSKPHLGTLYSTVIADVTARWNKLCGKKVFFLTGTDEHGQKIEEASKKAGVFPKQFVDSIVPEFKKIWEKYEINYDKFIRTTDKEHEQAVVYWIKKLQENGDIYKSLYSGWYCVPCETFVNVGSESIKDENDNYLCPSCKRQLKEISEESYFFRLSAYQDRLLDFYEKNPNFIVPKERLNEVVSFVKSGLHDLSISRKNVKWGIPFPGDPEHTVYVWGDALNNYISAIGYGKDDQKSKENFNYWWPADLHIMAKDIVRFHAVYWPAFLMAANLALPKKLLVHGYILVDKTKMSKSLGNIVDPEQLAQTYGIEPVRYYLVRQFPVTQDGDFSIQDLENRISGDLANNLGNLLNRTVSIALANGLKEVAVPKFFEPKALILRDKCEEAFRNFWDDMSHCQYHVAISNLCNFISQVNTFFQEQQPWVAVKKDKELFEEIISTVCHSLYSIAIMLWPVMPSKMEELLKSLGYKIDLQKNYEEELRKNLWDKKFVLTQTEQPLFIKPEPKKEEEKVLEKAEEFISIDDFAKVQLHVGKILSCQAVTGSEKLYKLEVDLGKLGKRQVLSGVAQFFKPEELVEKLGVYVTNLAPRKMMGLESQGMMLFAKDEKGNMRMVTVSGEVEVGTRLS
jgi:methionyl-tRNA synthetase